MKRFFIGFLFSILLAGVAPAQKASSAFDRGIKASTAGDFKAALVEFREAAESARTDGVGDQVRARIHFNAGVCLYRLREFDAAVADFEKAVRLDEKYEKAYYSLGMTYAELGKWPFAKMAFEAALRVNDRNGETWFDLAYAYLALGDDRSAERSFRKAIRFRGGEPSVSHNNIGVLYAVAGRTEAAIAEFETAIRLSSGSLAEATANLDLCRNFPLAAKFELAARSREGDE